MPKYTFNTRKFCLIWFSLEEDIFLTLLNQNILSKMRLDNHEAQIAFLHSSKLLSAKAIKELSEFCRKFDIKPIDIDFKEFISTLITENDKKLHEKAQLELQKSKEKEGCGSVASASDIMRSTEALLKEYVYKDFDVSVDFSKAPEFMEIDYPIFLPFFEGQKQKREKGLSNDIIIFAVDDKLELVAKKALHEV